MSDEWNPYRAAEYFDDYGEREWQRFENGTTPGPSMTTHMRMLEGYVRPGDRILDAGAVMHLATVHPTSAEAVWAAVATGKLPQKNGVRSLNGADITRSVITDKFDHCRDWFVIAVARDLDRSQESC